MFRYMIISRARNHSNLELKPECSLGECASPDPQHTDDHGRSGGTARGGGGGEGGLNGQGGGP